MERLTGKQVQTMMEALHQVYVQPEVEQLDEKIGIGPERERIPMSTIQSRAAQQRLRSAPEKSDSEKKSGENMTIRRGQGGRGGDTTRATRGQGDGVGDTRGSVPEPQTVAASGGAGGRVTIGKKYAATLGGKQGTVTYGASGKKTFTANAPAAGDTTPTTPTGNTVADKTPTPAAKPVPTGTVNGQKFERRLPTMAELRAAQAARAAAKASGGDRAAQEKAAVAGGVQQAQRQASVDAAVKRANSPEVLNRQAPAGSALRAQQDRLAAQKATAISAKPAVPTNNTATAFRSGTNLAPGATPIAAKPAPTGGYSTRSGDGKPYKDGPLWGPGSSNSPSSPARPKPQVKKEPPMRDEPLW